jgi:transcriptional regulator with XRE-family HTH domain
MALVGRIKELCTLKSIKIEELGKEIGIGEKSIYRWDKNSPSTDKLEKVADYFDVSIDYLLERRIYLEDASKEPDEPYIMLSKKARDKGMSPETLAKLIDLYAK